MPPDGTSVYARAKEKVPEALQPYLEELQEADRLLHEPTEECFHDAFLSRLLHLYADQCADSPTRPTWKDLKTFLQSIFPIYENTAVFTSLRQLFAQEQGEDDSPLPENISELKKALQAHTVSRLVQKDPFALERPLLLNAGRFLSGQEKELSISRIDLASVPFNHEVLDPTFEYQVHKRSQGWMGRWQPRVLRIQGDDVQVAHVDESSTKVFGLSKVTSVELKEEGDKNSIKLTMSDGVLDVASEDDNDTLFSQLAGRVLLLAVYRKDLELIRQCLSCGGRLDSAWQVPKDVVSDDRLTQMPITPLQLALVTYSEDNSSVLELLLDLGSDPGQVLDASFFHLLLDEEQRLSPAHRFLFSSFIGRHQQPFLLAKSSDRYRWTLLMLLCHHGDHLSVMETLSALKKKGRNTYVPYVEYMSGSGDNALHVSIKACRWHTYAERISSLLLQLSLHDSLDEVSPTVASAPTTDYSLSQSSQLPFACDANGESALHLALKARLWVLVASLVGQNAVDPTSCDAYGNQSLHLALKVGAPAAAIAGMVSLYQPSRGLQVNSGIANTGSGLSSGATKRGYEHRDRHGNDTPLTLALKLRQQELVELLLSAGAEADVKECKWHLALPSEDREEEEVEEGDLPLHVAIKSGLETAASALVAHGANLETLDARRASPLALSIRFGMYALSWTIAKALVKEGGKDSMKRYLDEETGSPVCFLALQSGQVELTTLLLDLNRNQMKMVHQLTSESLVHVLTKHICWLELGATPKKPKKKKKKKRRRRKKKDGDLSPLEEEKQSLVKPVSSREQIDFYQGASTLLIQSLLQNASDGLVGVVRETTPSVDSSDMLSGAQSSNASSASSQRARRSHLTFHLPTKQNMVITDHRTDVSTALHAAAAGGQPTRQVLGMFLAFLNDRSEGTCLGQTAGGNGETPLHGALASHSSDNAMLVMTQLMVSRTEKYDWSRKVLEGPTRLQKRSPLHLAAKHPKDEVNLALIRLLLEEDVFVVWWDCQGLTPLHVAVRCDCDERFIKLWKEFGQDLNVLSEKHGAMLARSSSYVTSWSRLDTWDESLEYDGMLSSSRGTNTGGSSVSDDSVGGGDVAKTPLMLCVEKEKVELAKCLVEHGAKVRMVTPVSHMGLLHLALQRAVRSNELIELLLSWEELVQHEVMDSTGLTTTEAVKQLRTQLKTLEAANAKPATEEQDDRGIPTELRELSVEEAERRLLPTESSGMERMSSMPDMVPRSGIGASEAASGMLSAPAAISTQLAPSQAVTVSYAAPTPTLAPITEVPGSSPMDLQSAKVVVNRAEALKEARGVSGSLREAPPRSVIVTTASTDPLFVSSGSMPGTEGSGSMLGSERSVEVAELQVSGLEGGKVSGAALLDQATLQFLMDQERATLTIVAREAQEEARAWLAKRAGKRKILSDARARLEVVRSGKRRHSHNRSLSSSTNSSDTWGSLEKEVALEVTSEEQAMDENVLLEKFQELAAERFIDKHVTDAVNEARLELEREKQAIYQDTGIYPGSTEDTSEDE